MNIMISLTYVFDFELCVVPLLIIDELGLLRKENKANLVKTISCCTVLNGPLAAQSLPLLQGFGDQILSVLRNIKENGL